MIRKGGATTFKSQTAVFSKWVKDGSGLNIGQTPSRWLGGNQPSQRGNEEGRKGLDTEAGNSVGNSAEDSPTKLETGQQDNDKRQTAQHDIGTGEQC